MAAVGAADGYGDMLHRGVGRFGVPVAEGAEPPPEITAAIAARRPVVRTDAEIDLPPRALQLGGDLDARGARADHQRGARRQLAGIAIIRRMHLRHARFRRHKGGDEGTLERAGGDDDMARLDRAG